MRHDTAGVLTELNSFAGHEHCCTSAPFEADMLSSAQAMNTIDLTIDSDDGGDCYEAGEPSSGAAEESVLRNLTPGGLGAAPVGNTTAAPYPEDDDGATMTSEPSSSYSTMLPGVGLGGAITSLASLDPRPKFSTMAPATPSRTSELPPKPEPGSGNLAALASQAPLLAVPGAVLNQVSLRWLYKRWLSPSRRSPHQQPHTPCKCAPSWQPDSPTCKSPMLLPLSHSLCLRLSVCGCV